jgi:predicted metalloprotease with PDZ domain
MIDRELITIADYWQDYLRICRLGGIEIGNKTENKTSFYAGVLALFAIISEARSNLSKEAWRQRLDDTHGEVQDFFIETIGRGPGPTLH